ncbi:rod shape-determining protein RodA [Olleya sp. ITB9]|uniref:rod shape-determining protein RodA n=1 Tax=Olleya sp. ITB9 TaxID=1715648 RepID=UPI00048A9C8F|nr:rod shape-determining protein RodA [Olleya sp. ITB9]
MLRQTDRHYKFDWLTILLFFILVIFGWVNIISASHSGEALEFSNFSHYYSKQLIFIALSVVLIILVLSIESKFYERFSSIIYFSALLSLAGLFIFGKNINGATSWYPIGSFTFQPGEFAKVATALAVAKYVSDLNTDIKRFNDQLKTFAIIVVPAFLVLLQPDAGSAIVYGAFFFVLYREGLPHMYLIVAVLLILLSIFALKLGATSTLLITAIIVLTYYFTRKKRPSIFQPIVVILLCTALAFSVRFFYDNILPAHQKDRITIWLSLEKDPDKLERMKKTVAYNLNESEKAISSGGFKGKGFLEGTRTTGNFVPEQHTDYIFSTVGEEWGFIGSFLTVLVFLLLIIRILILAERQKNQFSRMYGYAVGSILFLHFLINIGMVMGLIPTIGIPLPFFSYGGSGLWGFTILVFIFIKLDSNRINEW